MSSIAITEIYTVPTVVLQDGTKVELRPLSIKFLKKFMAEINKFGEVKEEAEGIEILIDCAGICLEKKYPDLVGNREKLEDALDMPTVYKIIEVCGGIKLDDPNLIAAAMETQTDEAGTT